MQMDRREPVVVIRPDELDETTVVARAQDGDLDAFEYLVGEYQGKLFRLAFRMLNDRGEAEDVVQDTLVACWRKLPLLTHAQAFGGWLYQMATNRCLDTLRRRSIHPETIQEPATLEESAGCTVSGPEAGGDPARAAEISLELDGLAAALETLPPTQRACWLLREIHGRSYAEIASTLKVSEQTVRGRLARARIQLAEKMSQWR
ncbi:RNA polymerase sigma factor [Arthrobacter sp. I2-34]|uniref:RNA polymerase sigma factor n=1 Tax=Arthrobacter hankyongi TaxID=2904801 RepID=A0ABS9LCI2_9MICC|nr:RNA polymerase sigma factor [Arthrobacter hankyongi]MCG2624371.1 RNA polymerase sigma factor [Arthrobacter hankyongi]